MENRNNPENKSNESNKLTDSSEIVRRHLEDENHEITDEDMRNVKIVGIEGGEPVTTGAEAEARFGTEEEAKDDEDATDARPGTPWDVISGD
jgi:hypothetical protein